LTMAPPTNNSSTVGIVVISILYAIALLHQLPLVWQDVHRLEAATENSMFLAKSKRRPAVAEANQNLTNAKQRAEIIAAYYNDTQDQYDNQEDYQKCKMNEPWPRTESHGCVVESALTISYCQFEHFRIDVAKIKSVRGGEALTAVMGQAEDVEFPTYTKGAFQTMTPPNLPDVMPPARDMFYIHDVINALETKETQHCVKNFLGTTMFITRYEYCNLYHTMTDWWNTFLALSDPQAAKSIHLVFLDGHPQGNLDVVWEEIFASVTYVQHLPKEGVCFEKAILIPPGYMSQLWTRNRLFLVKRCPAMTDAFVKFMVAAHGLNHVQMIPGLVILIERVPYIGHPRSQPGKAARIIQNMALVRDRLAKETTATQVRLVQFETMTFREQLELIRSAHVMIGNHGAGITHLLFLNDGAHVLEFSQGASTMMTDMSAWKPTITHTLLPSVNSPLLSDEFVEHSLVPAVKNALNWTRSI